MLVRMAPADVLVICRAFVVMIIIVVLGVMMAESQMDTLTRKQDFVQVLNIRDEGMGNYEAYLFGYSRSFSAVYQMNGIDNGDQFIAVGPAANRIIIPTMLYIDASKSMCWLELWSNQFLQEAAKTARFFAHYAMCLKPYIGAGSQYIMALWAEIADKAASFIDYYR